MNSKNANEAEASFDTTAVSDMVERENSPFTVAEALDMIERPSLLQYHIKKLGDDFYSLFFLSLLHEKLSSAQAEILWAQARNHYQNLQQKLERDPGFMVALVDYLQNFSDLEFRPIIIDAQRSSDILDNSTRDALTGLFRRQVFDQMLEHEFDEVQQGNIGFCLLMIDIDDFKKVNDTWGHQKGDEVLSRLGSLLLSGVRKMDTAARYGGEELIILMPETPLTQAEQVASRVLNDIAQLDFDDFSITVSIGVSNSEYNSAENALKAADEALYKAKRNGKNQVVVAG